MQWLDCVLRGLGTKDAARGWHSHCPLGLGGHSYPFETTLEALWRRTSCYLLMRIEG